MKSPSLFQRLLRARLVSFGAALVLHLGWALALAVLLIAVRRGTGGSGGEGAVRAFIPVLVLFALLCAGGSSAVWGWRQKAVRWIRELNDDDVAAALAAASTAGVSMLLVGLVAAALPSLARTFSRGELDALMAGALALIGVLAIGLGWIVFEGLGGVNPPLPGKLESSFAGRFSDRLTG